MAELIERERAAQMMIVYEVKKAMDLLKVHFETYCTQNNVKEVPNAYISASIDIFLKSYTEAAKGVK
jgi:hypothetical protein